MAILSLFTIRQTSRVMLGVKLNEKSVEMLLWLVLAAAVICGIIAAKRTWVKLLFWPGIVLAAVSLLFLPYERGFLFFTVDIVLLTVVLWVGDEPVLPAESS